MGPRAPLACDPAVPEAPPRTFAAQRRESKRRTFIVQQPKSKQEQTTVPGGDSLPWSAGYSQYWR